MLSAASLAIFRACWRHASTYLLLPVRSRQTPFHAGAPEQWVACSWEEYTTILKHRPGWGLKAVMRSPSSGIGSTSRR